MVVRRGKTGGMSRYLARNGAGADEAGVVDV